MRAVGQLGPSFAVAPQPEDFASSILQPCVPQNLQTLSNLSSSMCLPTWSCICFLPTCLSHNFHGRIPLSGIASAASTRLGSYGRSIDPFKESMGRSDELTDFGEARGKCDRRSFTATRLTEELPISNCWYLIVVQLAPSQFILHSLWRASVFLLQPHAVNTKGDLKKW